jgi:hypothetical protein
MSATNGNFRQSCAYCGKYASDPTHDHVVPRALWNKRNLPPSTVTVPSCRFCHQYWDREAEYFRNILVAQIDRGAHPVSDRLLEGTVTRSLIRSQSARNDFFRNVRQVEIRNQSGLILGYRAAFEIDLSRFSRSIEKIVRGLFYRKSCYPLPIGYRVTVSRGNEFWNDAGFQNLLSVMEPVAGYGDDVFLMRCVRDGSDENVTAWLLQFYRRIGVFAWTEADSHANGSTASRSTV